MLRDAEAANIPFSTALTGALRRCSSRVWPATPRSERLALHPASTAKNGTLTISASLITETYPKRIHFKISNTSGSKVFDHEG